MSDVENNMDDLFRRAAEGYLLKKARDDWDNIAPLLEQNPGAAITTLKGKDLKKYSVLILSLSLFLLIAGFIVNYNQNKNVSLLAKKNEQKILTEAIKGKDDNKNKEALIVPTKKNTDKKKSLNNGTEVDAKQDLLNTKNIAQNSKKRKHRYSNSSGIIDNKESEKITATDEPGLTEKIFPEKISNATAVIQTQDASEYATNNFVLLQSISSMKLPGKRADINAEKKASLNNKENRKQQKGIYLGFMTGVSFNQIKTQGLQKPGYDIGVIAGYQINPSLSIETGLMYDRKNYFSSGKYFDMTKLSAIMPANMKVLSLEGSCAVLEIPVKIKYNLSRKGNSHFYSIVGVSSYIMTNEYNKYRSITNGTEQNMTGTYNNNSRYLAAALDISLGYESKIGSYGNIRIEPYLQMPLKGIGIGSLPVMTAGMHIGFTRLTH